MQLIQTIILVLMLIGCDSHNKPTNSDFKCVPRDKAWHIGDIDPPIQATIWHVELHNNDVVLNNRRMTSKTAIALIGASADYDPPAYVLLRRGTSSCARFQQFAAEVSQRFNCNRSYCYVNYGD